MPRCGSGTCRGRGQITRPRRRLSWRRPRPRPGQRRQAWPSRRRPRPARRSRPRPRGSRPWARRSRLRADRGQRWRPRAGRTGLARQRRTAARAPRPAVCPPLRLPRLRPRRPSQPGAGAAALQARVPRARTRLRRGTEAPPAMRAPAAPGETRAAPGGRGIAHADAFRADHPRFMITVPFQRPEKIPRSRKPGSSVDGQACPALVLGQRRQYAGLLVVRDHLQPPDMS
jgi:hypothetical protein